MTSLRAALVSLSVAALVAAPMATASCLRQTPAQLRAQADVIFDGVALDGPTPTGVQRFRVTRYRKGAGPAVVRVRTGWVRKADGTGSITSVSIAARKGERWRIFSQGSATRILNTTLCDGSRRL